MSPFTATWRARALAAWKLTTDWPAAYGRWRDEMRKRSLGEKASSGCLGILFFGIIVVFIPIVIFLLVETGIIVVASAVSVVWGVGVIVDKFRRQPPVAG